MIFNVTRLGEDLRNGIDFNSDEKNAWRNLYQKENLDWGREGIVVTAQRFLEWGAVNLPEYFNKKLGFNK